VFRPQIDRRAVAIFVDLLLRVAKDACIDVLLFDSIDLEGRQPDAFDILFWNADSTNLPGPMYCWYVRNTYLENNLRIPGRVAEECDVTECMLQIDAVPRLGWRQMIGQPSEQLLSLRQVEDRELTPRR